MPYNVYTKQVVHSVTFQDVVGYDDVAMVTYTLTGEPTGDLLKERVKEQTWFVARVEGHINGTPLGGQHPLDYWVSREWAGKQDKDSGYKERTGPVACTQVFLAPEEWLQNPHRFGEYDFLDEKATTTPPAGRTPCYIDFNSHTVYNLQGKYMPLPVAAEVWGKMYPLKRVEEALKGHAGVISFEIVDNDCYQNHDISGRKLGKIVVDPAKLNLPANTKLTASDLDWQILKGLKGFRGEEPVDALGIWHLKKDQD